MMNEKTIDILQIIVPTIVPAIISVIGFIITYLSMRKQFLYNLTTSTHEPRRKLYVKAYKLLSRTFDNPQIVFSQKYEEYVTDTWVEISVSSESEVYEAFNAFYEYIKSIRKKYVVYCKKIDYERYDVDETGRKIPIFSREDIEKYDHCRGEYMEKNQPQRDSLNELINPVLACIRKELKVNR